MGRVRLFALATLVGFLPVSVTADPPYVHEVPTVTGAGGLQSADFGMWPYLVVDDYAAKADGGGGYFVLDALGGACLGGADGGVSIRDGKTPTGNCFLRRFTGAVHLRWFDGTSNRARVDLRGAHANYIDVLQSSDTNDCNEVIASQMDVDVANAHDFENDLGCLILTHGNNSNVGVALVADASTQTVLSANRMPNVTLFAEDDAAFGKILGDNTNQYFGFWCNPRYAPAAAGCVQQQMQASGRFTLKNPGASPVWEYYAGTNMVLQPHADQLSAVVHSSVADLPASINVATAAGGGIGTKGVQLPVSTGATDLVSNRGAGGCIQVVNFTSNSIQVWDHSPEQITNGSVPVDGNTGVPLAAWKTATFCPVSGVGWVGN